MALICAILLSGLLLTCNGHEQSGGYNWHNFAPAPTSPYSNATIRLHDHEDHGTQSQTNQKTTEELQNIRWPQWPPNGALDDYASDMLRNYTNAMQQTQTNQSQNHPHNQIKNNDVPSHIFRTGGSAYDNNTIKVEQRPDGERFSTAKWGYPEDTQHLAGAWRVTMEQALLLQWHVGVYSKAFEPYMQICGGTLVTTKAVISAAHCFWSDLKGALPASQFAIAAGKLYRPWNDGHDLHAQKSEISRVELPPRFRGGITSFQDDIAVVLLATAFTHSPAIRPLCVLFDEDLEYTHLRSENQGVIMGWGLTAENGPPAQALQYLYMPYVPIEECVASVEPNFLKYITSDKICAGVTTGKALCRGDSGGGLVFFDHFTSDRRPLLFGVASTAPRNEHLCNTHTRATLTRVLAHGGFLRTHIPDIEENCAKNYASFLSNSVTDFAENRFAVAQNIKLQRPQPTKTKLVCNCYCNSNSTKP